MQLYLSVPGIVPLLQSHGADWRPELSRWKKNAIKNLTVPKEKKKKKTVRLVSTIWCVCILERKLETGTVHRSSRSENTTYGLKTFGAYRAPGMAVSGREDPTAACVERKGFWPQ